LIIIGVTVVSSFVQGYSGFGLGIISMTTFSFLPLDIERASVVVTIISLFVIGVLFLLSRSTCKIPWKKIILLFCGVLIGSPLGYWFIAVYGKQPVFNVIFGVVLLYFSMSGVLSPHVQRKIRSFFAVSIGAAAGFISGAFVSGGPPVVLYLYSQTKDPREMKAALQAIFFMMSVYRLAIVGAGGIGYSKDVLIVPLYAVVPVVSSLILGHALSKYSSAELFRKIVYALLGLVGVIILIRGTRGLII